MNQTTTEIRPVFTSEAIAARVSELGAGIRRDTGDAEVFFLCILKGASIFLADLLRSVTGDVSYGFIDVIRESEDNGTADALEIDFLNWVDIAAKNVYILKDVVSTGVIETYLLTQLRQKKPAELKLVQRWAELSTSSLGHELGTWTSAKS